MLSRLLTAVSNTSKEAITIIHLYTLVDVCDLEHKTSLAKDRTTKVLWIEVLTFYQFYEGDYIGVKVLFRA